MKYISLFVMAVMLSLAAIGQYTNRDGWSVWNGRMSVGTTQAADPSSLLMLGDYGIHKSVILPRVAGTGTVVSPTEGMFHYDVWTKKLYMRKPGGWFPVVDSNYYKAGPGLTINHQGQNALVSADTACAQHTIYFKVGDVGALPSGANTYTSSSLIGKKVRVYREGELQDESVTYGIAYVNTSGAVVFYPNLNYRERVTIEYVCDLVYDASVLASLLSQSDDELTTEDGDVLILN